MVRLTLFALLGAGAAVAAPLGLYRRVTLDQAATAEAQQRDDTATRAVTAAEIKTSDGQCLTVDPLSGDFRENLIPIQFAACNGSDNQQWDVITEGKHITNQPGFALIVSSLTNGCLNFDPRRAAGDQVILFSCGGRADGSGQVTDSQLFAFDGNLGPAPLTPQNGKNAVCLKSGGQRLDQTSCDPTTASGNELFTIGAGSAPSDNSGSGASPGSTDSASDPCPSAVTVTVTAAPESTSAAAEPVSASIAEPATTSAAAEPVSTSIAKPATTSAAAEPVSTSIAEPATTSAASATTAAAPPKGTTVLNQAAVAEAQQRDDTATRAFSGVQVKTSDGQCLSVDANSGDFRENLIPVTVGACDGSDGQKFDVITAGKHNNVPGTALIVSTLTQGCLNFDPRRAAGNQVILFSCGGRADGGGLVTNSQLFSFAGGNNAIPLVPTNVQNTCLVNDNGLLDVTNCDTANPSADELFSFAA